MNYSFEFMCDKNGKLLHNESNINKPSLWVYDHDMNILYKEWFNEGVFICGLDVDINKMYTGESKFKNQFGHLMLFENFIV